MPHTLFFLFRVQGILVPFITECFIGLRRRRFACSFAGVWCSRDSVFVYCTLGGSALLPCTNQLFPDCSLIRWTFYKGGDMYIEDVSAGSDQLSRVSVTSNCSLHLRDLRVDDVGSYSCSNKPNVFTNVYLSLLTITSPSKVTDLQPGGNLSLTCTLFTYYDAGSCRSYSSAFNLSWVAEDGTGLPKGSRLSGISRPLTYLVRKIPFAGETEVISEYVCVLLSKKILLFSLWFHV